MEAVQIFLSYAHKDRQIVANIYDRLKGAGFRPWIDHKDILGGEKWETAIKRAIEQSSFFLACMSPNSVNRRGVLQRELRTALDLTEGYLEEDIFIIPVWIDVSPIPEGDIHRKLSELQWVVLSDSSGWENLLRSLRQQLMRLGKTRELPGEEPRFAANGPADTAPFPTEEFVERLKAVMATGDRSRAELAIQGLVEYLGATDTIFPAREADRILRRLAKKRWLKLRQTVAEALLQARQNSYEVRRQYAESLLEDGIISAALALLEILQNDTVSDPMENAAVRAARGAAFTQLYLKAAAQSSQRIRHFLQEAIRSYLEVYDADRKRHLAHGANAVALLSRAERD